jgi:sec-independent protein translocase protein TatA
MIGYQDLLVLLGIGIFFFGAKKLPELSRSLGQALVEFKKGVTGATSDTKAPAETAPTTSTGAPPSAKPSPKDDERKSA